MTSFFDLLFARNPKARGEDRRQGDDPNYTGPDRRSGVDRRGLRYGVVFKTHRPIGPIQQWLDQTIPGQFRLSIEGMTDDLDMKEVKVVFANEGHREEFKAVLADYLGVRLSA